jgi:hypothetical protein
MVFSSAGATLFLLQSVQQCETAESFTPIWNSFTFQKSSFFDNTYLSGFDVYLLLMQKLVAQVNFSSF